MLAQCLLHLYGYVNLVVSIWQTFFQEVPGREVIYTAGGVVGQFLYALQYVLMPISVYYFLMKGEFAHKLLMYKHGKK